MTNASAGRFVGRSIKRHEDARLVTGHGRYVDDVQWPQTWHAAFVRSPIARGAITYLDTKQAAALPGVRAVLTGADLNPLVKQWWHTITGPDSPGPPRRLLAEHDVRFVGDAIAIVLADSRYVAEDAADLVEVEFDAQPGVVAVGRSIAEVGADPQLVHPELGSNVAGSSPMPGMPQSNPALDEALADAAHVVEETFDQHRYLCVPMEPRGIAARWDPHRALLEIVTATQNVHEVRAVCARVLGLRETEVRVVAEDVGGGFGQKIYMGADELCVAVAAYQQACAVRWTEDRNENLLAGGHARQESMAMTMGVDEQGRIVGIKAHHTEDVGAFPVPGIGSSAGMAGMQLPGPYDFRNYFFSSQAVYTNTCGHCAYRGPWMMETVAREQMMDVVARKIGLDPLEFRRRNVIRAEQLPYTTVSGMNYETVTPAETLEQAAELIGYDAFRAEQAAAREQGRLLGIGLSSYIEGAPGFGMLGAEQVSIRVDYSGKVMVYAGTGNHGQGIETTLAQVVAEQLGVDIEDVRVHQGDTDSAPFGQGTGGSRTAAVFGAAATEAGQKLRSKILQIAAAMLEASADDLEVDAGVVNVKGVPGAQVTVEQVARAAYGDYATLPGDIEPGLEASHRSTSPPFMFSNATHAALVEVDPETGVVTLLRYVISEDCGNMINPMVVEGQISGGVVQGIGGVFYEHFVYDDAGTPLTTTFLDYLLPTACEVPDLEIGHLITPASTPGGYKPIGEGGAIVSPAALINAVRDALAPFAASVTSQPLTPDRVWTLMAESSA